MKKKTGIDLLSSILTAALILPGLASCGGGDEAAEPLPIPPAPAAGQIGDGRLPELLEWARASQLLPAMGIVFVQGGQIVEQAVVGRRSETLNVPVTVSDRWHLGSLTKAMTSTLAAELVEQSVITWDTTALDVWPELSASIHPGFRNVTLRQLLSHTSGMVRDSDWSGAEDSASGTPMQKRRAWAGRILSQAPAGPTGQHLYSNVGYVVAGAMLETRTGAPWETLLTQHVFAPLGMNATGYGAPGTVGRSDEPWGHWQRTSGLDPVPPGPGADNAQAVGPAGTVHSTFVDYGRFMAAHIAGARGIPGIVTAASFAELHTPHAGYALGWGVATELSTVGGPGLDHRGSNLRWFALVWLSPSNDAGMLVVTNAGGPRAEAAVVALDRVFRERFAASR